jgi:hypothetical protein
MYCNVITCSRLKSLISNSFHLQGRLPNAFSARGSNSAGWGRETVWRPRTQTVLVLYWSKMNVKCCKRPCTITLWRRVTEWSSTFLNLGTEWSWVASFRPQQLCPWERVSPGDTSDSSLGVPQTGVDTEEKRKIPACARDQIPNIQCVGTYVTELHQLINVMYTTIENGIIHNSSHYRLTIENTNWASH